jgi:hypothetical protein
MSNKTFLPKAPKVMAMSVMNDSFIIANLTWNQRKSHCANHIMNYIASQKFTRTSQTYWGSVAQEIEKL